MGRDWLSETFDPGPATSSGGGIISWIIVGLVLWFIFRGGRGPG